MKRITKLFGAAAIAAVSVVGLSATGASADPIGAEVPGVVIYGTTVASGGGGPQPCVEFTTARAYYDPATGDPDVTVGQLRFYGVSACT